MKSSLLNGISLTEIAQLIGAEILGKSERVVRSFCSLDEPTDDGLSFTKTHRHAELEKAISSNKLSGVIVPLDWIPKPGEENVVYLKVKDPLSAMSSLTHRYLAEPRPQPGISDKADIHPSAQIGAKVHIGAFCVIGEGVVISDGAVLHPHVVVYSGAKIGENSVIHSSAVIRENCVVGKNNIVQNGAIIGADGFGYFLDENNLLKAVPQVGKVVLADGVEIGANSCIDRATLGTTSIGTMSKVDNLVQVGHNTKVGKGSILCGHAAIAGSCEIGNQVTIGGCVGIADHITIIDGCRVGGKSGVISDLTERGDYLGFPAIPAQSWRRQKKALESLPDLLRKSRKAEKKVDRQQ